MCQIIYSPNGIAPNDLEERVFGETYFNHDGIGLLRLYKGNIDAVRMLTTPENVRKIVEMAQAHNGAWAIHLRKGTSGRVDVSNVHPFDIGDDHYLMHNGIFSIDWKDRPEGGSDTAALAAWLQGVPPDKKHEIAGEYLERIGNGSRLLIAGPSGADWYQLGQWRDYPGHAGKVYTSCSLASENKQPYDPSARRIYYPTRGMSLGNSHRSFVGVGDGYGFGADDYIREVLDARQSVADVEREALDVSGVSSGDESGEFEPVDNSDAEFWDEAYDAMEREQDMAGYAEGCLCSKGKEAPALGSEFEAWVKWVTENPKLAAELCECVAISYLKRA